MKTSTSKTPKTTEFPTRKNQIIYLVQKQDFNKPFKNIIRNEKIRMGREERRQKHDLAEEKREVFRTQIRQKYGIKSKEEAELDKVSHVRTT